MPVVSNLEVITTQASYTYFPPPVNFLVISWDRPFNDLVTLPLKLHEKKARDHVHSSRGKKVFLKLKVIFFPLIDILLIPEWKHALHS